MPHRLHSAIVTRPWHWGIAIVSDASLGGEIPEVDPARGVTGNHNGLIILVRHAQDIPSFDGEFDWAEATVTVTLWEDDPASPERPVIYDDSLDTPSGRLSIGDADDDLVVAAHHGRTRVVVSVTDPSDKAPDSVWVDLYPQYSTEAD